MIVRFDREASAEAKGEFVSSILAACPRRFLAAASSVIMIVNEHAGACEAAEPWAGEDSSRVVIHEGWAFRYFSL